MWSIAKRELRLYFGQLTGFLLVAGYLLITGLILWFFDTPYNLLNTELASYSSFFEFTPILFLFLIPALSMRSFSEEFTQGTFELLITKPLSPTQIFGGKLIGVMLVLSMILIPTPSYFRLVIIYLLIHLSMAYLQPHFWCKRLSKGLSRLD